MVYINLQIFPNVFPSSDVAICGFQAEKNILTILHRLELLGVTKEVS